MRTCVYVVGRLHLLSAQGGKDDWKIQGRGKKLRNVAWKFRGGVLRNVAWKCRRWVRDVAWKSKGELRNAVGNPEEG